MPDYRRSWLPGGTFFFTVVTHHRQPILTQPECRHILHNAWTDVCRRFPFTTLAICLLPDHLHCIWTLPSEETNYAVRWKEIKRFFTRQYRRLVAPSSTTNASRLKRKEAGVWQRRYWEHTIRDETDLQRHIEYIHYNPVRHQLVNAVADWPWSSFSRYVQLGFYDSSWGQSVSEEINQLECGE